MDHDDPITVLQPHGLTWHLARAASMPHNELRALLMCVSPDSTDLVTVAEAITISLLPARRPDARLCSDCRRAYVRDRARGLSGALTSALTEGTPLDAETVAALVVLQGTLAVAVG